MRKHKGNAIAQYAIIIGLVAIALVPVLIITGQNISKFFSDYNNAMASNNSTVSSNAAIASSIPSTYTPPPPIATSGDASPETPQLECSGSDCSINFGDYVLDGIPSDFTTYVNSAGSSGGTESLAAVLEELAEEADISEETKNLIKDLADAGHSLASAQNSVESIVNNVPVTAWVSGMYSMLEKDSGGPYDSFIEKRAAVETLLEGASTQDKENIKAIIDVLSNEIVSMNSEFVDKCNNVTNQMPYYTSTYTSDTILKDVISLKPTGVKTDIDSAIICQTGNGESTEGGCE